MEPRLRSSRGGALITSIGVAAQATLARRPRAESETWQYGLLAAAAGAFAGYSLGIVFGFMGPVHLLLGLFVGTASYPIGLVLFSPRPVLFRGRTRFRTDGNAPAVLHGIRRPCPRRFRGYAFRQ